ncbi:hypothetical protein DYB32_003705 [Aphanomyces invadans]|uniref:RyR/IP3R Homology associated domain-containing protein n=1 Tax=Aphanomyces invadans TaxID=157072 RepID=A0A3R6WNG4_9STRA|nr:hypothetical protein DYB32_003705 [Aphanomyces invadans]
MEGIELLRSGCSTRSNYMAPPASSSIEDPSQDDPMEALVTRLQQIQTAPSVQIWEQHVPGNWAINYLLLELDTLIRFLRDKRTQADHAIQSGTAVDDAQLSYDDEKRHKLRLYALKEWRDIQKKAVRLNVADLIVSFLPPLDAATKAKMLLSNRPLDDRVSRQGNLATVSASSIVSGLDAPKDNPADVPGTHRPSLSTDDKALTVPPNPPQPSTSKSGATVPMSPVASSFSTPLPLQQTQMEDKLLELVYEFIAGGFVAAQDALYDAILEQEDRFVVFLMRHLKRRDESPFVLVVLQQLCENHHSQWQALMRANDPSSFLHVIARQLMDVYWKEVAMSEHDTTMCSLILGLFTEACQGPCDENQRVLEASPALDLCVDLVLGLVRYEDAVPVKQRLGVQRAAANVLLAMMEGRTDMVVQNAIAKVLTASRVLHRILAHHKTIVFKSASPSSGGGFDLRSKRRFGLKGAALPSATKPLGSDDHVDAAFMEVIHLLQIAFRMTNSNLATSSSMTDSPAGATSNSSRGQDALFPNVVAFVVEWEELKTKFKAHDILEFFQREMMSVEVSRLGASFTVYFLKPKSAKYFDKTIKRRFLNNMDMGTDDALQVLIAEPAQAIQEELNVMGRLEKLGMYSWLNEWHWQLRMAHLYLCAYINFVLIMTLKYPASPGKTSALLDVELKTNTVDDPSAALLPPT